MPPLVHVGRLRNDDPRTAPRLVSGCSAQERCQTGPQTAQSGGDSLFCPLAGLGRGLDRTSLPPPRPRPGRLDTGATLHHPVDQCGSPRLCHPRGLARRRSHACRRLASSLGSPLGPLTRQRTRRLDRDCAGRPGLVRAMALYDDSSPGLAFWLTSPGTAPTALPKSTLRCSSLSGKHSHPSCPHGPAAPCAPTRDACALGYKPCSLSASCPPDTAAPLLRLLGRPVVQVEP